jgi:arylsulfatase A-like enzyme
MSKNAHSHSLRCLNAMVLIAASAVALGLVGCRTKVEKPNVLFIVVDTLRADHLPDYGYDRDTMGALAAFTKEATRFERCYAPSSWTLPSTASIVTGLLPARHGALHGNEDRSDRIPESVPTLPALLHDGGWSTGAISLNPYVSRATGFDRGYDAFLDVKGDPRGYPDISKLIASGRQLIAKAPRPFFLYLQPMNTHGPYKVPPTARATLLGHAPNRAFQYTDLQEGRLPMRARALAHPEIRQSLVDQYDTAVRYSMDSLAGLLQGLREQGLYDDMLIVVTADHGEELLDHGGFAHGYSLYNEMVHVPLYIKLPGQRRGGAIRRPVGLIDLMPTVLKAVGVPVPKDLDGVSLLPLLKGKLTGKSEAGRPRDFVLEISSVGEHPRCDARGLIRWPFKLIRTRDDYQGKKNALELFDLRSDPHETLNLGREQADRLAELESAMDHELQVARANAAAPSTEEPAKLDRKTLEALGYL